MASFGYGKLTGGLLVACWLAILVAATALRLTTEYETHKLLHWFEGFYRTGSIIFGGGQASVHSNEATT